jgi:hypothetical protein
MKRRIATMLFLTTVLLGSDCDDDDDDFYYIVPPPPRSSDLNVDGYADLVIGAPFHDGAGAPGAERGAVFVHLGSASGPSATPDLTILGAEDGGRFGAAIAFAGDVNGRGAPDLLVGAPGDDADGNGTDDGLDRGRAFVFFGGPSMDAIADVTASGSEDGARLGESVARVGDTNLDGFSDWLAGAPLDDGDGNATEDGLDRGRAFFYYGYLTPDGIADRIFTGAEDGAEFGFAVASAGDLNDGGAADIAVGAPLDDGDDPATDDGAARGRVYVSHGGDFLDTIADLTLTGDENDAAFGAAVAPVFDVNGDRVHDLLVGAPLHDAGAGADADRGAAFVFFGATGTPDATADLALLGGTDDGAFGAVVAGVGDLDGDDARDFAVGAPLEDPGGRIDAGSAYLYAGGAGLDATADLPFDGAEAGARFGAVVASPGDLDGGGRDLLVGAPLDDADGDATDDGFDRGSVFLFSGVPLDTTPDLIFDGAQDAAEFGSAIAD